MRRLWFALTTATGPPLVGVSLAAWSAALWLGGPAVGPHRRTATPSPHTPEWAAWLLMVLAMMPPLLTEPIGHLWNRSLTRRRWRQILLFAAGYVFLWVTAGWLLVVSATHLIASLRPGLHPTLAAVLVAVLWQTTPMKQTCLNRCHRLPPLRAFGAAADRDAVGFGLTAGGWCVGSCWALMLLSAGVDAAHIPAMAAAGTLMLVVRVDRSWPVRRG